jgi:hypothetical protein
MIQPTNQQLAAAKGSYRLKKTIPLSTVLPGRYVVRIETGRGSDIRPIVRTIPITVLQ